MNTRQSTPAECRFDRHYLKDQPWHQRLFLRLFKRRVNSFAKDVISRASERSQVDSFEMHEMAGTVDRMLWPELKSESESVRAFEEEFLGHATD